MVQKNTAAQDERVELFVPRAADRDDPNLFISVNGVNYLLPRGKTSSVPREVAYEYHRSVAAQEAQDRVTDELLNSAAQPR